MVRKDCANSYIKIEGTCEWHKCKFTKRSCIADSFDTDAGVGYVHHNDSLEKTCPLYSDVPFSKKFINLYKKEMLTIKKSKLEKEIEKVNNELKD